MVFINQHFFFFFFINSPILSRDVGKLPQGLPHLPLLDLPLRIGPLSASRGARARLGALELVHPSQQMLVRADHKHEPATETAPSATASPQRKTETQAGAAKDVPVVVGRQPRGRREPSDGRDAVRGPAGVQNRPCRVRARDVVREHEERVAPRDDPQTVLLAEALCDDTRA